MMKIKQQSGSSLIEVLVAVLVLSAGLLGAVALQFATAKEQRSAQFVSRAALVANEMAERMRTNRAGLAVGLYDTSQSRTTLTTHANAVQAIASSSFTINDCSGKPAECSPAASAEQADFQALWAVLRNSMPQASAHILPVAGGATTLRRDIVLAWVEPVVDKDKDGKPLPFISSNINGRTANSGCPTTLAAPEGVRCYTMRFAL
jgi:type IV pilus modification protein PilV